MATKAKLLALLLLKTFSPNEALDRMIIDNWMGKWHWPPNLMIMLMMGRFLHINLACYAKFLARRNPDDNKLHHIQRFLKEFSKLLLIWFKKKKNRTSFYKKKLNKIKKWANNLIYHFFIAVSFRNPSQEPCSASS